jgi:DNA relaxase NicK
MMQHKIDYYSYSKNLWGKKETPGTIPAKVAPAIVRQHIPSYMPQDERDWIAAPKKKYFLEGIHFNRHCGVWVSKNGLILTEHTGLGCTYLEEQGLLGTLINEQSENCTRIDIASDILTDITAIEFITSRDSKSAKSYKIEKSSHGLTYNLGSKHSERHVKVYRYDPPHPRSDFLRIEYTYHREDAKIISRMLRDGVSIEDISVLSGKRYKWTHSCYKPHIPATDAEIKAWRPERKGGKTLFWLYKQVIPAIAKEVEAGHVDLEALIADIRKAVTKRS